MKKLLLFNLLTLVSIGMFAQRYTDRLYLKNGSILNGILMQPDSLSLGIQTKDGNIWIFAADAVDRTEKVLSTPSLLAQGYHPELTFGVLAGAYGSSHNTPFSVNMGHLYQWNNVISTGVITGVEFLNEAVVPLSFELKFSVPIYSMIFFVNGFSGYSLSLDKPTDDVEIVRADGGINAGSGLGIIFPLSGGSGIVLSLGYQYNELNYKLDNWYYGDMHRKVYYNRLSLKLGVMLQ
jgi:hypothetical protein